MIGYKVTAKCPAVNYVQIYDGWFEGDPKIESKAKEIAAKYAIKQAMKQGASLIIRGAAGSVVTVADLVTKPIQGLGSAIGEFIAEKLKEIHVARSSQYMAFCDVAVTLSGDFEGAYRLATSEDVKNLPLLLALISEKNSDDSFMGESVVESAFFAQVNFVKHLASLDGFDFDFQRQQLYELELEIDV